MTEFDQFWERYPRKIGKLAAMKAYEKARTLASAEEILVGVENYRQHLPDPQFICHATSFLNQGRWMDEYDVPIVKERRSCPHTPRCHSPVWCEALQVKEREREAI